VIIRAACVGDAAACAAIYAPFVSDSWVSFELVPPDAAEIAARIETYSASHAWLVAEADDHVIGYAYGSPHRTREAYRPSCDVALYVDPAFARQGAGRALYTELLSRLAEQGCHAAFAGIALPNEASAGLHKALGFTPIGIYRDVGWKLEGWRDVEWWQRRL
jgi:L-amino acid N-acyltransferase YncA